MEGGKAEAGGIEQEIALQTFANGVHISCDSAAMPKPTIIIDDMENPQ
jgi:hypothetical protein